MISARALCFIPILLLSGCLVYERATFMFYFSKKSLISSGEVFITYQGIKSSAKRSEEIYEDYKILSNFIEENNLKKTLAKIGLKLILIKTKITGSKLNIECKCTFSKDSIFNKKKWLVKQNEEIFYILGKDDDYLLENNGKIYKTNGNYILVWPANTSKLYWILTSPSSKSLPSNIVQFFKKKK